MWTFNTADLGQVEEPLKGEGDVQGVDQQAELACRRLHFFGKGWMGRFQFLLGFLQEKLDVIPVVPEGQKFMNPGDGQGKEHKACKNDGYPHHRDGPAVVRCDCF